MKENTFSIIIPCYNREKTIARALNSLRIQDYNFAKVEIIIVNDGSTDDTYGEIFPFLNYFPNIYVINFEKNKGRLAARNAGMAAAKNDWICWLDSDDEYCSTYLSTINAAIDKFPDYKVFNFGAIAFDEQNFLYHVRDAFMPGVRKGGNGHDVFKSGGIGSGSFVFRRSLLMGEDGFLPEANSPYGDDESFPARAVAKWPDLRELYGKTDTGQWQPLGNPWGDDYLMFFALTRNNLSKPLNIPLYLQHVRHG
jgi:glycosyltransferase involved in cell wall biosynthesis